MARPLFFHTVSQMLPKPKCLACSICFSVVDAKAHLQVTDRRRGAESGVMLIRSTASRLPVITLKIVSLPSRQKRISKRDFPIALGLFARSDPHNFDSISDHVGRAPLAFGASRYCYLQASIISSANGNKVLQIGNVRCSPKSYLMPAPPCHSLIQNMSLSASLDITLRPLRLASSYNPSKSCLNALRSSPFVFLLFIRNAFRARSIAWKIRKYCGL